MKKHYEDAPEYQADAYRISGWAVGIAWRILGWETEPDDDTEWSGCENRTGKLVAIMIGDDKHFAVDPDDVSELRDDEYCCVCGQIGCHCNF
ncbi:MAG: hypothetical protein IMZ50_17655 [Candidatus Atribacteria bacterium]|nr:hypothetical protein [Candidatus Atribacteria bacterium]